MTIREATHAVRQSIFFKPAFARNMRMRKRLGAHRHWNRCVRFNPNRDHLKLP